jgi:hypothetical protein
VDQSGTFPKKWSDFNKKDSEELHLQEEEMVKEALLHDYKVEVTPEAIDIVKILGG